MPVRSGKPLSSKVDELDGATKIAILLLTLDQQAAGELLRRLPTDLVEEVTSLLASIGEVPADLSMKVIEEFYSLRMAGPKAREGGIDYAAALLKESLEPTAAERVIQHIQTQVPRMPFSFLQNAHSENVLAFIQDEHPQTIAMIVSHLPHEKASQILTGLPTPKQIEVVRRVATMEQTNPDVIREVEAGLEGRLSNMLQHSLSRVGGVEAVAEILNLCDRNNEKTIMDGVEAEDPDLVSEIRKLMFVFEDILLVTDKGIQTILKEIDNDELCLALKTASEELKQKIFSNISARAAELIKEDMQYMGPVRLSDVESAQQRIVDVVRRLEDAGEIVIAGRGGEGDMIV